MGDQSLPSILLAKDASTLCTLLTPPIQTGPVTALARTRGTSDPEVKSPLGRSYAASQEDPGAEDTLSDAGLAGCELKI
ncbi:hypothetical protein BaRGS_00010465 [Batillaria attramentaria]|uniref:Uncharacterized protein n=1 Tax=Batillaria attramentaria TaxID=370345 RepID=A0ABD0LFS1_9CAEN